MKKLIPSFILEITAQMFPRLCYGKLRRKWYRIALCFLLPTIITGCSSTLNNIKPDQPLKMEEGILVIHFHPAYEGLYRSKEKTPIKLTIRVPGKPGNLYFMTITSPYYLKVITLPAGEYRWYQIKISGFSWRFSPKSSFVVQAGKMIYLGDIYVHLKPTWALTPKGRMVVKDKYEEVLKLLNEWYPSLVKKYGLSKSLTTMKF